MGFAIMNRNQMDSVSNDLVKLALKRQTAQGINGGNQIRMAINIQITRINASLDARGDKTNHPHNAQNMIRVLMSDKNMVNLVKGNLHILQNGQDSVPSAGIGHEETAGIIADGKASVVAAGNSRVASAEYVQLFHG